jgi:hypothetical protein
MKEVVILILLIIVFSLYGCGGGPSDTQVEEAIKSSLQKLEKASMGFAKVKIEAIEVGDKNEISDSGTYEIEVTTTVTTNIAGQESTETNPALIKMREINDQWVLVK